MNEYPLFKHDERVEGEVEVLKRNYRANNKNTLDQINQYVNSLVDSGKLYLFFFVL